MVLLMETSALLKESYEDFVGLEWVQAALGLATWFSNQKKIGLELP